MITGVRPTTASLPSREKIVSLRLPGASLDLIGAVENLGRLVRALQIRAEDLAVRDVFSGASLSGRAALWVETVLRKSSLKKADQEENALPDLVLQWLSFYGPVRKSFLKEVLGFEEDRLDELLAGLAEAQEVVLDLLTEQAEEVEICDRENLEILLRMARRSRQAFLPGPRPGPAAAFSGRLAGPRRPGQSPDDLQGALEQLFGFPAAVDAWEKQFLPARLSPYYGAWLDGLIHSGHLLWFGCGHRKISLAFPDDLELFLDPCRRGAGFENSWGQGRGGGTGPSAPREIGRYSFLDIIQTLKNGQPDRNRETLGPGLAGAGQQRRLRHPAPGDPDGLCPVSFERGRRPAFPIGL